MIEKSKNLPNFSPAKLSCYMVLKKYRNKLKMEWNSTVAPEQKLISKAFAIPILTAII